MLQFSDTVLHLILLANRKISCLYAKPSGDSSRRKITIKRKSFIQRSITGLTECKQKTKWGSLAPSVSDSLLWRLWLAILKDFIISAEFNQTDNGEVTNNSPVPLRIHLSTYYRATGLLTCIRKIVGSDSRFVFINIFSVPLMNLQLSHKIKQTLQRFKYKHRIRNFYKVLLTILICAETIFMRRRPKSTRMDYKRNSDWNN